MSPVGSVRVVAIVQARMGSTRLPGKVLAVIEGRPMLKWVVDRASRSQRIDQLLVATSDLEQDDPIEQLCRENGIAVFRGHPTDVLDRFYRAASQSQAEVVVRLTADCPLIDPELIDQTIRLCLESDPPVDFAANRLPDRRTFPIGLDVEVCSVAALERAWKEADQPYQREHVMPYLYEIEGRFLVALLEHEQDLSHLRWAVDEPRDLSLVRRICAQFSGASNFGWREVLALMERQPELASLNAMVEQRGLEL